MAWKDIIGQNRVKTLLQRAIIDNKISQSYCFIGGEGVGKDAVSIEFAKAANCQNPIKSENGYEACGECKSCRMTDKLEHPNIHLIFSLPTGTSEGKSSSATDKLSEGQIEEVREQIRLKAKNPYGKISIAKATQIKIVSIREIKRNLSLSAPREGRRFILVFNAEDMTKEAANAFLKTLEEPRESVTIILTTSNPGSLLPTILSRCQQTVFQTLPHDELAIKLQEDASIDAEEAKLAAVFGQGSYTRAFDFLDKNTKEIRENIIDCLRSSLKKKRFRKELLEKLEYFHKDKDRKIIEAALLALQLWLRDALLFVKTNSNKGVINYDYLETIQSFCKNFGKTNVEKAITIVETAVSQNNSRVNHKLLLINAFLEIRKALAVGGV